MHVVDVPKDPHPRISLGALILLGEIVTLPELLEYVGGRTWQI